MEGFLIFTLNVNEEIALKLIEQQDAPELFALVDGSRSYLQEWLPWVDKMKEEADYKPMIDMWLKQFSSFNGFQAAILYQGKIAGMAGFHGIDWVNSKTSIGYWLAESYQGRGIMTETVRSLVNVAFKEYGLNRVEIQCGVGNEKSQGIPERLGFKQEGIIREPEYLYDHFHDHVLFSILAKEWLN